MAKIWLETLQHNQAVYVEVSTNMTFTMLAFQYNLCSVYIALYSTQKAKGTFSSSHPLVSSLESNE